MSVSFNPAATTPAYTAAPSAQTPLPMFGSVRDSVRFGENDTADNADKPEKGEKENSFKSRLGNEIKDSLGCCCLSVLLIPFKLPAMIYRAATNKPTPKQAKAAEKAETAS